MLRGTRFLGLVCGGLTALSMSCSPTTEPTDSGPADSGPPAAVTYTYVIDQLRIDANDNPDVPHAGFNLDTFYSSATDPNGCNHDDYGSVLDLDQNMNSCMWTAARQANGMCRGGVDSQLPTLANTIETAAGMDIRAVINEQVNGNKLALVVRVTGVNGVPGPDFNDSDVNVKIYLAYPTFTTDCMTVAANREYVVSRSSITDTGTTIEDAKFAFTGSIVAGRLQVTTGINGRFELPLPAVMGHALTLPMHATQVRATLTPNEGTDGNLGGWVSGNDVVTAVGAIAPEYITVVEGAIGGLVDIQVENVCEMAGPPRRFGGIGLGLKLHFVPATLRMNDTIQAAQATGTCGYTAPTDAATMPRDVRTGG